GSSASRKRSTCALGCAPTNSAATRPSLNAFTAGIPWIPKAREIVGLASVSSLASATLPSRALTACSRIGPSWRHGPHHSAQKSTTTGSVAERSITCASKSCSVTSKIIPTEGSDTTPAMSERIVERDGVRLAVEEAGPADGVPVVLLHGLTATRRYVVMGSKALERGGHRVVAYDARGHGRSSPGPDYSYGSLSADLAGIRDELGIERPVLAGASMGAHTIVRLAMERPEGIAAAVLITPAHDPDTADDPDRLA